MPRVNLILSKNGKAIMFILKTTYPYFNSQYHGITQSRIKTVVVTDIGGDPDDNQSMVRQLLYANDMDIIGITCGLGKGHTTDAKPEQALGHIKRYEKVLPSLRNMIRVIHQQLI